MSAIKGGEKAQAYLSKIANDLKTGTLKVGFKNGATYPDGESVANVAFKNEFGDPVNHQPPRPFFRRMVSLEKPTWPIKLEKLAKTEKYDGEQMLSIMGEDIRGALMQSINTLRDPPLSKTTIELKGFDKPLIDSGVMVNSITYDIE